ncbi:hypothetical protein F5Y17DRAFT_379544 [Xylariaceae sp. FL0594]|nr:hypothetical protein F5Y17DRAFT_379544 [Xylariaceae sp. FL0594]
MNVLISRRFSNEETVASSDLKKTLPAEEQSAMGGSLPFSLKMTSVLALSPNRGLFCQAVSGSVVSPRVRRVQSTGGGCGTWAEPASYSAEKKGKDNTHAVRLSHQLEKDIPPYAVAEPRPPKPPLSPDHFPRNGTHCAVNLLTPLNLPALGGKSKANLSNVPSTITITLHYLSILIIPAMEHPWPAPTHPPGQGDPYAHPMVMHSNQLTLHTVPTQRLANNKRRLSNITDPSGMEDHARSKIPRRRKASRPVSKTRRTSKSESTTSAGRLFACPFSTGPWKSRQTVEESKACMGTGHGWEMPRSKEHIWRRHTLKMYRCNRCHAAFEQEAELWAHQTSDITQCPVKPPAEANWTKIDLFLWCSIKKKTTKESNESYWADLYRKVHRLDATAEVPSPYYDPSSTPYGFERWVEGLPESNPDKQACLRLLKAYTETEGPPLTPPLMPARAIDSSDPETNTSEAPSSAMSSTGSLDVIGPKTGTMTGSNAQVTSALVIPTSSSSP